jgi:superfamily II DNA or RNA helicase
MIVLREYQQQLIDSVKSSAKKRILIYSETGSGKSIMIAYLANDLSKLGRVLILTHRIEILEQNAKAINSVGILTAKVRTPNLIKKANVVIAMAQTAHARFKKYGSDYVGHFDYVIVDEAHTLIFDKVYEKLKYTKLFGFTATPNIDGYDVIKKNDLEYKQKRTLAKYYDVLIEGVSNKYLIEKGYLTPERAFALKVPYFDRLEKSGSDYSSDSLNATYNNTASRKVLKNAYLELCKGKKVILFNSGTKNNKPTVELFTELGVEARSYDSVNNTASERDEILDWFRNTKDGILVNTGVFTTGLDVPDIDVVIVNRATLSLNLWRQMVGRGARIADGKFEFTTIDLGQNIDAFGTWSSDVDWQSLFEEQPLELKKKVDVLQIWECKHCGAYNLISDDKCVVCGLPKEEKKSKHADKNGVLVEVEAKPTLPNAKSILEYTIRLKEGSTFAFKLLDNKIMDLMFKNNISKDYYLKNRIALRNRIKKIYVPIYFAIIKSKLEGKRRKLNTQLGNIFDKIDERMG